MYYNTRLSEVLDQNMYATIYSVYAKNSLTPNDMNMTQGKKGSDRHLVLLSFTTGTLKTN